MSFHPELNEDFNLDSSVVTTDEDGNPCHPYTFTRVQRWRWERNRPTRNGDGTLSRTRGFTRVANSLPLGFAEAIDLDA